MRKEGAITAVTAGGNRPVQAAYLIRSEAVAKFSSFRQLVFSTIRNSTAVTRITCASDAGQSGLTGSAWRDKRCFSQQETEANRIGTVHHLNPLKTSLFEVAALRGQRKTNAVLLQYASEIVAAIFLMRHSLIHSHFAISFRSLGMYSKRRAFRNATRVWFGDCL